MTSYYTLRVSRSDVTAPGKSIAPYLYVRILYGEGKHRTRSVNKSPPQWNETFPITCSNDGTRFTIELMREAIIHTNVGSKECYLEEILRENGEDVCISLQSKSKSQHFIFLSLQKSDETKNAELFLLNLAQDLLDIPPSNHASFADNVNAIFDMAKRIAESGACQTLVEIGYTITAFVEFGNSIANEIPYVKLAWCLTTAFLKIFASQPKFDERVKDLVKNLMNLFLITKETSVFNSPSNSLRLTIANILEFIKKCSVLIHDYAQKSFLIRSMMQNKKSAIEDLEASLVKLKKELESAFMRQNVIETRIECRVRTNEILREKLEKKLQPKHEGRTDRQSCLKGTRVEVLKVIEEWIQDTNVPNVFFILGRAGTGKSTIATTIAEEYQKKVQLGSHQYFLRDKSDPAFIFRTIAYDLARRCQRTANAIDIQLDANEITCATPERAFEILLFEPLYSITEEGKKEDNILIVLDALDECGSRETREPYIRLIKEGLQTLPPNYRFLITSRPEEDIASSEDLERLRIRHLYLDHESKNTKGDVEKYIQTKLNDLKERDLIKREPDWPWDESMKFLGEAANGLFIWATTAVRRIENCQGDMGGELKYLVETRSLSLGKLYEDTLSRSLDWDQSMITNFSRVLSLIMFGKEQLLDTEINSLLGLDYGKTRGILNSLHSLVAFEPTQPVRLYHTSLCDYLVSKRTRKKVWYIDEIKGKAHISQRCFKVMESLRFNICNLETSYQLNKNVPGLEQRVKDNISTSLLYACCHWASHLREVPYSEDLCKQLESFSFNRLLYWVEVLSLTGSLYVFLSQSLENAITWVGNKHAQLSAFLQDALNQLLRFIEPISQSSPHLYMTFLPLMREESIVAEHYAKQAQSLARVEYVGNKPKMACNRQIVTGSWVNSISYSPDGERIASGSREGVVEVWDVVSGRRLLGPLHGHSKSVMSVVYSVDGKYIASGSRDKTVRLWNALTGEGILGPLLGHSMDVISIAFSRDGKFIVSVSYDNIIRLWDTESGAPVKESFRTHSRCILSVVFSPNGRYLASGLWDGTIIVWDAQTREMASDPFKGHSGIVYCLSFSPDSGKIASGSWDDTIRVWESSTGNELRIFSGDGMGNVFSVAYSSDGERILSGSSDGIVRMWDAEDSGAPPKRYEGHTKVVSSVSFAPDRKHLASGSFDGTIRIWDVERGATMSGVEFKGHTREIRAIVISPETGKFLVSCSNDNTVCVWNTESGESIKGPLKQFGSVVSLAFSSDENHFASGSYDGSVRIWNMIDDKLVTCKGHTHFVISVAFSPDCKYLASGSYDKSIRVWNVKSGLSAAEPFIGNTPDTKRICSVCYSPDGKKIVSGSDDKTVRIWDASNGSLLSTFEGHSSYVYSVAYSHDGLYVVSGSSDSTVRVWNTETGQAAYSPLVGHVGKVNSVCLSLDGKWIISGSWDKSVCVWNASTGVLFFRSRFSSEVNSVAPFPSSDNRYIKFASGSRDGAIQVWSIDAESEEEKWLFEDNGWLMGNNNKLLLWIPQNLRHSIVYGPRILNRRFYTSLDSSVYRGDQWTACFPSNTALA